MNTADLGLPVRVPSTALFTDQYELTMLQAALKAGTAGRHSVFEVFTRRLPEGRRYGVVAGTGRVLDAVENFRFDPDVLGFLAERKIVDQSDVNAAMRAAAAVGDDRLQKMATGRISPESFTHGSSRERTQWFQTGLNSTDISACDTFSR